MVEIARFLRAHWVFALAVLWLGAYTGAHAWPAAWWLSVRSTAVFDGPADAPVLMDVQRSIHRPFHAEWSVLVRQQRENGWTVICTATGNGDYIPAATLPSPLTLRWWTNDQCSTLDVGTYYVSTIWRIEGGVLPTKVVQSSSNIFVIGG